MRNDFKKVPEDAAKGERDMLVNKIEQLKK